MDFSPRLRRLDFNLLLALAALLDLRNISRAAERVGVGQPAMSESLRRLRRIFDDPLLVRSGNTHGLTSLGEALVEPVATILATTEKMLTMRTSFDPAVDATEFTIAASDYMALLLLRPLMELAHREAPNVSVKAVPMTDQAAEDIRRSRVDVVIVPQQLSLARTLGGFPHRELFRDTYLAATCRNNDEIGDTVDKKVVENHPYLRYQICADADSVVDEQLAAQNIETQVALTTFSLALVPALLPGTRMFGFVNQRLLQHSPANEQIRVVPTTVALEPIQETMYWHPAAESDPAQSWLREKLVELADAL